MTSREHGHEKGGKQAIPDRRKNFRVDCPVTVNIIVDQSGEREEVRFEAQVLNLSLGGIGIRMTRDAISHGLGGRLCTVLFQTASGRGRAFRGSFVGIYCDASHREEDPTEKTLEAGIRFEGLSMDDQFALVDLFGKIHTPLGY